MYPSAIPWRAGRARLTAAATAALTAATMILVAPASPAAAAVLSANDYCLGQCADILPPGRERQRHARRHPGAPGASAPGPAHSGRPARQVRQPGLQLRRPDRRPDRPVLQRRLVRRARRPGREHRRRPRSDVTIVRDKATGVPHITGTTRAGTMFGAGYAGAQDRLFLMDLMRHVGARPADPVRRRRARQPGAGAERLAQLAVHRGRPAGAGRRAAHRRAPRGAQLYDDVQNYIAGHQRLHRATAWPPGNCPGEYVLTGHLDAITNAGGPEPFTLDRPDRRSPAWSAACSAAAAAARCSPRWSGSPPGPSTAPTEGDQVWAAFREQNDPETVLTLHNGQSFPYGHGAGRAPPAWRCPTPAPPRAEPLVYDRHRLGRAAAHRRQHRSPASLRRPRPIGPTARSGMSNAVVVSGRQHDHRQPDRRVRAADRLLRAAAADAAGAAGPGHQRARRRVRRAQPVRAARPRARTTRGAPRRPGRTSPTRTPCRCATRPAARPPPPPTTTSTTGSACRWRRWSARNAWTPTAADSTAGRLLQAGRMLRTKYGLVTWRGHGRRRAGRVHQPALDLPARGRLGDRLPDVQRPGRDGHAPPPSPAAAATSGTRSTGSTSTRPTRRTSTPAQPGAPGRRRPEPADRGPSRRTSGRAGTRTTNTATYTPDASPSAGGRTRTTT